jgi:glycine dehydrogenase subunit 1
MKKQIVYPYIPNTAPATKAALMKEVNAANEREIFDVIPERLLYRDFNFPEPILDELSLKRHTNKLLDKNYNALDYKCFLGVGCAPHYIPSVVEEVLKRGEFYTAYTSDYGDQGRGQLQFEYQSQMAELLDMDVIAFPQYDGGSSLGHAVRMANRITGKKKVLYAANFNPLTISIAKNYLRQLDGYICDMLPIDYDEKTGLIDLKDLKEKLDDEVAAIVIENPSFIGTIEINARKIGELARFAKAEFIVYSDPISLGILEAPGAYGATIACGDIHSLGIPMYAGSGVGGYVMVKDDPTYAYQLKDMMYAASPSIKKGEISFSFEASFDRTSYEKREECFEFTGTSAGLWTASAGVYMATMGPKGMKEVGELIIKKNKYAKKRLSEIDGATIKFEGPSFKEFVVDFNNSGFSVQSINEELIKRGIIGGYDLSSYDGMENCMLLCITEIHSTDDINDLVDAIKEILS